VTFFFALAATVLAFAVRHQLAMELQQLRGEFVALRDELRRLRAEMRLPGAGAATGEVAAAPVEADVVAMDHGVAAMDHAVAVAEPMPAEVAAAAREPVVPPEARHRDEGQRYRATSTGATEANGIPAPLMASAGAAPVGGSTAAGSVSQPSVHELEHRVGSIWTLRIGLVAIAVAAALFARTVVPGLAPAIKVALAYAGAGVLFASARHVEARFERFARPVMAAALSLAFFVSFAAHFVPAMRAVGLVTSLVAMTAFVVAVLVHASRWRSQPTAGVAIFLGHVSAFVVADAVDGLSLVVIAFLSATAVVLLIRNDWVPLSLFAAVAAYVSHTLWAFAAYGASPTALPAPVNLAFLVSYYLTFLVADGLRWWRGGAAHAERLHAHAGRALGPVNLILFVAVGSLMVAGLPDGSVTRVLFYFVTAGVQAAIALWFHRRRHPDAPFYLTAAVLVLMIGLFLVLEALALGVVLAALAAMLMLTARTTGLRVAHHLAHGVLLVNFVQYLWHDTPARVDVTHVLGAAAVALAYGLMALLEEHRAGRDAAAPSVEAAPQHGSWISWGEGFRRSAPNLAIVHAIAGSVVLMRETWASFPPPIAMGVAALTLALLAVAAVVRGSPALGWAWLCVQVASLLFVVAVELDVSLMPPALARPLLVAVGFGTALWLIRRFRTAGVGGRRALTDVWLVGAWVASAAALGHIVQAFPMINFGPPWPLYLAWIAVVGLLFACGERSSDRVPDRASPWGSHLAAMITVAIATALVVLVTHRAYGGTAAAPAWTSLWTLCLVAAAWRRRDLALYLSAVGLLLATYASFLDASLGVAVARSVPAAALVIAVPLVIALFQDRLAQRLSAAGTWSSGLDGVTVLAYALAVASLTFVLVERIGPDMGLVVVVVLLVGLAVVAARGALRRAQDTALIATFAIVPLFFTWSFGAEHVARLGPSVALAMAVVGLERATRLLDPGRSQRWPGTRLALVAIATLVTMVALVRAPEVGASWTTVGWSLVAVTTLVIGFAWRSGTYRRAGLAVFGVSLVRVVLVDVPSLPTGSQMVAFLILGVSLVAVAWLYARFGKEVRRWL
jgi:hypothetical protein